MSYDGPDWSATIAAHKADYDQNERQKIDKASRLYRGDSWTPAESQGSPLKLVSYNLVFAIIETATSATVPNNLAFTVYEKPETTSNEWEDYLAQCDRQGDWRGEACLSMLDAMLTGRSVLKTSPGEDLPVIRAVDPRRVYFDLAVRRPDDITYFIEFCPMTKDAFEAKLRRRPGNRSPVYKLPASVSSIKDLATQYPEWLSRSANKTAGQQWIPVYEVVDIYRKTVTHWIEGVKEPLCEWSGEDYYNPYSLYNLNLNGQDCRGESEVTLVEDTVAAINRILVYWAELIRKQVPIVVYDSSRTDETEIQKLLSANAGAAVGVNSAGLPPLSAIQVMQPPQVPPDIKEFMAKLENIVSYVTATMDLSRGQLVGAKTATEVATMQSLSGTRVQHRVSRFNSAWEGAAKKALYLARVKNPEFPDPWKVTMVAYSPLAKNREVLRERFLAAYAIMAQHPDQFDQDEVNKLLTEVFDLPPAVLITEEDRAEAAANAPQPSGGMPPGMPPGLAGMLPPPEAAPAASPDAMAPPPEANPNALALLQAAGAQPEA